ncbi:septal ring lytic transglycosylase RlpA family protein [Halomonas sp. 18H]|uniref:septal ring lytic transglycosylase RlpA family protein n=1 Tax=Halomonas almeriensis TaxID=308163 RepID=UPI0022308C9C|nr:MULTISPECIES: septal ring lytic transglycosylase RlpA family protein [Halomonas]MCW4151089.1 septal ring lytic transglycosylase RlpA family protein [Halomonas sp. 18H]MDN3552969.1 septal ring lytic transglycosylase RlpA family protein [Halomonas almeriensis]
MKSRWSVVCVGLLLAGCASDGGQQSPPAEQEGQAAAEGTAGGRYAMSSDAYPEQPPDVSQVPDAVPRPEPKSRAGNKSRYEVWGKTYRVLSDASGYERTGTASWYGKKFHGYATSNGEIYDMYKMSAAHRHLPLPTFARVTNLDNGRSVIVRVNDRGPFHSEREIDLSYAAASRLDMVDHGTGRVRVEAIDPQAWQARQSGGAGAEAEAVSASSTTTSSTAAAGAPVYLQVAALGSADSARALKTRLEGSLSRSVRVASAEDLYRVQVGPLQHTDQVSAVRGQLSRVGFDQTFIVDGAD